MPSGEDYRAAYQARRAGSAVDIDLAAMAVLAWRTPHPNRVMLRPDAVDPATAHAVVHQLDEI